MPEEAGSETFVAEPLVTGKSPLGHITVTASTQALQPLRSYSANVCLSRALARRIAYLRGRAHK